MPTFEVKQTLARQRVVRVRADTKGQAEQFAKEGFGEVVSEEKRYGLLCSSVEKIPKEVMPSVHDGQTA